MAADSHNVRDEYRNDSHGRSVSILRLGRRVSADDSPVGRQVRVQQVWSLGHPQ